MKIEHYFSLNSDWYIDLALKTESELRSDNKLFRLSKKLGEGHLYFTEVTSGLSVLLMDVFYENHLKIKRTAGKDDLYILHFDFSEGVNLIEVENKRHRVGNQMNLGLAIMDSKVTNYFEPALDSKIFALRLLIDKKMLHKTMNISKKSDIMYKKTKDKKALHFYDYVDSNSLILINELKNKTEFDESFDLFIKGVALNLFANFLEKYSRSTPLSHRIKQYEIDLVNKTKDYLMDNLYSSFPGVKFLADMAGMSVSKYKILFKELHLNTPNGFFVKEKNILGNKLLTSGNFTTMRQVLNELNYTKHSHFNTNYYKIYKRMPSDDFIKDTVLKSM